jgi:hypothetical protein
VGARGQETVVEVPDGGADVVVDQVGVEGDGGADPAPAAVMTWARGSTTFPAAQTPGTLVRPALSTVTQPSASMSQPRPASRLSFGTKRGGTNSASRAITQPSWSCTPRSRSQSSTTSCSMVPSTTPMARASSAARSVAVRSPGAVK